MDKVKALKYKEKYGVNPVLSLCFFCGEVKDTIFTRKIKSDIENPVRKVFNYIPCEDCEKELKKGIPVYETIEVPVNEGQPPLFESDGKDYYPTGRFLILDKDVFPEQYKKKIPIICTPTEYEKILKDIEKYRKESEKN